LAVGAAEVAAGAAVDANQLLTRPT
jgi:hypothetical protein